MSAREGGCLCGAIRFEVSGEPIASVVCYCRDCQYVAGGAGGHGVLYPASAVTITAGDVRSFVVKAASGTDVERQFCPTCGVHIFARNSAHSDLLSVKIGAFDDPSWFRSQGTIWVASAQPWHHLDADLPRWETQPDY